MPGQQNSRTNSSRFGDLTSHLREDRDLREFLLRFLTRQPLDKQAASLEKILDIGLPVISDSAESVPEEAAAVGAAGMQPALNLTPAVLNAIVSQQLRLTQGTQEESEQADVQRHIPPFDEALLPQPQRFVDREAELDRLIARLEQGGTTGITALRGMGGIGKTALAARAAEKLHARGSFPDGIAVVLCRDSTDPSEVLRNALSRFDPARVAPRFDSLADLSDATRHLLGGKRALVILDNVEPDLAVERVVSPLREAGVTVLITARQMLPSTIVPVDGSFVIDVLPPDRALELLVNAYRPAGGEPLTDKQQAAANRITEALGRHTLAIRLAGAYAANVGRDLETLARDLQDARTALLLPDGDSPDIMEWLFRQSTDALPREAQTLFRALPAFEGVEFGRNAVIALGEALRLERPQAVIDRLVTRSLLDAFPNDSLPEGSDRERLRMHVLLYAFAETQFMTQSTEERNQAYRAVAEYFAHCLRHMSDSAIDVDRATIAAAITWAYQQKEWRLVVDLCLPMSAFWHNRWLTRESTRFLPGGIEAAEELSKAEDAPERRHDVARLRLAYARVLLRIGDLDTAEKAFTTNLKTWEALQDYEKQASVSHHLGQLTRVRGDLALAERYFQRSLDLRRLASDRRGEGADLGYLGRIAQARGAYDRAEQYFHQSLEIAREQGDSRGEGRVLNSLGQVALVRGDMEQAERYFTDALRILHAVKDRQGENDTATGLGRMALDRGDLDKAEAILRQCVEVDEEILDKRGRGADLSILAQVAVERGDFASAQDLIAQSLTICEEVQDLRGKGIDLSIQGRIALERGNLAESRNLYEKALDIAKSVSNRRGEGATLHQLGMIALDSGDVILATRYFQQSLEIAQELQSSPDIARATLSLARIAATYEGDIRRGCQLVNESIQRYEKMKRLPDLARAQIIARELGCGGI